jgi:tRNA1Val (adenine37-N6)-methyltransferase
MARHDDQLKKDVLLENVGKLLSGEGRFNMIIPFVQSGQYVADAASYGLYCIRRMDVRTRISKPFVRSLMEFGKSAAAYTQEELVLRDEQGGYSADYQKLTSEFHPYFKIR